MPKKRITFAKRHREMEGKRSADEKRQRRDARRQQSATADQEGAAAAGLSLAEHAVLKVFRDYEMSPRRMLCFSGHEHETHVATILRLVERKMLVAETFQGGYSLTENGYATMRAMSGGHR